MSTSEFGDCYVDQLTLGAGFGCFTRLDGSLFCWGKIPNNWKAGQKDAFYAVELEGPARGTGFADIAVGNDRLCGLTRVRPDKGTTSSTQEFEFFCWGGLNGTGYTQSYEADAIGMVTTTSTQSMQLFKDDAICGLSSANQVLCAVDGEKEVSTGHKVLVPFGEITSGTDKNQISQYSAHGYVVCGVERHDGSIKCLEDKPFPKNVPWTWTVEGAFTAVEVGDQLVCGLTRSGTAICEYLTELQPNTVEPPCPTGVECGFSKIAVGERHMCGIVEPTGHVHCWGANEHKQATPSGIWFNEAHGQGFAVDIAAGGNVTCVVPQSRANIICWGEAQSEDSGVVPTSSLDDAMRECVFAPWRTDTSASPSPGPNSGGEPKDTAVIGGVLIAIAVLILLGTCFFCRKQKNAAPRKEIQGEAEESALVEGGSAAWRSTKKADLES